MKGHQQLNNEIEKEEQGAHGFGHTEGVSRDGSCSRTEETGNLNPAGVDAPPTTAVVKTDEHVMSCDDQAGIVDTMFATSSTFEVTSDTLKKVGMEMEDFVHLINALRDVSSYTSAFSILKLYLNRFDFSTNLSVVEWLDVLFKLCTASEQQVREIQSDPERATEILDGFDDVGEYPADGFGWINQSGDTGGMHDVDGMTRLVSKREQFIQGLVAILRAPKQLKGHPMTRMVRMFLKGLVTIGMCPGLQGDFKVKDFILFTVDKFEEDAIDVLANLGTAIDDFGYWLVDVFAQGTVVPDTGSTDDVAGFDRRVAKLKSILPYFKAGRLSEIGKSPHDFFLQISTLEALGERMRRKHTCPHTIRLLLTRLADLDTLRTSAHITTLSTKQKIQAFGTLVYGESSVGKSGITKMLAEVGLQYKIDQGWRPDGDKGDYHITMNVADKFQSEYKAHHLAVTLDDLSNGKPEKNGENPLDFLVRLINNTPATALKADVGDKGAVPLMAEFVFATTNVKHLHAAAYSSEPISILRRVGFTITATVKPQYRIEGTMQLNPHGTGGATDLWTFDVEMPLKTSTGIGHRVMEFKEDGKMIKAKNIEIDQLLLMYRQYIEVYFPMQEKVIAKANAPMTMCKHRIPEDVCRHCKKKTEAEENVTLEFFDDLVVKPQDDEQDEASVSPSRAQAVQDWVDENSLSSSQPPEPPVESTSCPQCGDDIADSPGYFCGECEKINFRNQVGGVPERIRRVVDFDAITSLADTVRALQFVDLMPQKMMVWYLRTMMVIDHPFIRFVYRFRAHILKFAGGFLLLSPLWPFLALFSTFFVGLVCVSIQVSLERRIRDALSSKKIRLEELRVAATKPHVIRIAMGAIALGIAYKSAIKASSFFWQKEEPIIEVKEQVKQDEKSLVHQKSVVPENPLDKMVEDAALDDDIGKGEVICKFGDRFAFTEVPTSSKNVTMTHKQVTNIVEKNLMTLIFENEDGKAHTYCSGLAITSGFMLTVNHAFPEGNDVYFVKILIGDGTKSGNTIRSTISCSCIHRFANNDLALIYLPCIGDRKNIISYFPTAKPAIDTMVTSVRRDSRGALIEMKEFTRTSWHKYRTPTNKCVVDGFVYKLPFQTYLGLCGMVMIAHGKSPCIHSIHTAGVTGRSDGASACILQAELQKAVDVYKQRPHVLNAAQPGTLNLCEEKYIGLEKKIHDKSPLHDIPDESAVTLYGQTTIPVTKFRHSVHQTICHDDVAELFKMGPLAKPPPNVPGHRHYAKALINLTNPNRGFPEDVMSQAVVDYAAGVFKVVEKYTGRLQPMTMQQALDGVLHVRGIDAMNKNTSTGVPWLTAKYLRFLVVNSSLRLDETTITLYEFKSDLWSQGIRTYEGLNLCLKNAALDIDKDKVRVFQCANMFLSMGLRQYYSPLVHMIVENALDFECALGINCQGPDWDHAIRRLTVYGEDRIVAGDHKAYDQHMSANATSAAFAMLIGFAKTVGYDDKAIAIMETLATEVVYPMTYVNGDLVKLYGSNPSGHALTTVINSLVNSLYHRCVYFSLRVSPLPFKENVSLITYGDDCAYSVREGIAFGHTDVQNAFADFGLVYTMAQKDAESVQYISINQLSFLKRTPRWDEELGVYMAPLERKSIVKPLQWIIKSVLTPEQSAATNIDNAALEFFFHGRDVYNSDIVKLREIRKRHNLGQMCVFVDMTYDDMVTRWKRVYSDYKRDEHPELSVCKAKNSEGCIGYGIESCKEENYLMRAYIPMATPPDGVPLLRGVLGQRSPQPVTQPWCDARDVKTRTTTINYTLEAEEATAETISLFDHQSGVVTQSSDMDETGRVDAPLVTFQDVAMQQRNTAESELDITRHKTRNNDDGLERFFDRPALIQEITVAVGDDVNTQFNPWQDFLTNPRVINRINNYTNLKGKLHVKFMINGNGFYYGKLVASYLPLGPLNVLERPHNAGDAGDILLATQRQHIFLDPCNSAAGEMVLPFFWYKDSLSIVDADWDDMGTVYVESINPLRNANGSTSSLTISVYAWMSETAFDCPTIADSTALVNQMGTMDEYQPKGIISRPMTAAAGLAKAIGGTPFAIAPFATAASRVLSGGAALAKLMGYSRPPDLEPAKKMQPRPVANLANYDTMDTTTKLSLDTKQELTCDPRVMGAGEHDELTIDSFVTRQNFITAFNWSPATNPQTLLQQVKVFPYHTVPKPSDSSICYPSYGIPALDFRYWQGTMRLKLQVACSNFHKGRLLVVYDPQVAATQSETNVQYSYIMDIADQKELTIEIPWSQPQAFGVVPAQFTDPSSVGRGFGTGLTKGDDDNGVVSIFVLNELTTPSSSTESVFVNAYVSFKEGMKFVRPDVPYRNMGFATLAAEFENQSGEMPSDCADDCQDPTGDPPDFKTGQESDPDAEMLVYGGENIRTMRALLKRPGLWQVMPLVNGAGGYRNEFFGPIMPRPRGYYGDVVGNGFNYVTNSFMTIGVHAFTGYRGAVRWKFISQEDDGFMEVIPTRSNSYGFDYNTNNTNMTFPPPQSDIRSAVLLGLVPAQENRAREIQHTHSQQCLEGEFPYYSRYRFTPVNDFTAESGDNADNRSLRFTLSRGGTNRYVQLYTSVGEDFTLSMFTGLPPVVGYTSPTN